MSFSIKLSLHGQKSLIGVSAPKNLVALVNIRYIPISYKQAIFKVPKGSLKKSDPEPRLSGRPKGTKKTRLVFTINQVDAALVLGLSSFLARLYCICT